MDCSIEIFIDLILAILARRNSLRLDLISLSDPQSKNHVGNITSRRFRTESLLS